MASRLRSAMSRVGGALKSPLAKKIGLGIGAVAGAGALAYGGYKAYKAFSGSKKRRQTLARIRNKRRIVQEKTKYLRATRTYNREVERQ